jgi:hypothetical protein
LSSGNDRGEDVALHGNTEGKGNDVEEQQVGGIGGGGPAREDTSLNSRAVGNGLIRVDALLELLAVEEVAEKLLDLGDTGGATDKDNLVNLALVNAGVLEHLLNRLEGARKGLCVQVLETGTGNVGVKVFAVE